MTQEQLAMLLGVSRQSVTKWESERAYPEMDKLIKMCQLFECTLDDLVLGDLTNRPNLAGEAGIPAGPPTDVCGYDEHHRKMAWKIPTGIACILLGIAFGLLVEGLGDFASWNGKDGAFVACVLAGVLAGIALLIPAGMAHSAFVKAHPFVEDFYTDAQKSEARTQLSYGLIAGIAFIFAGIVIFLMFGENAERYGSFFLLLFIALGVWNIVHWSMLYSRTNVQSYNDSVADELEMEDIVNAQVSQDLKEALVGKKKHSKKIGAVCGVIMIAATIVGLVMLFAPLGDPSNWIEGSFEPLGTTAAWFWVAWPVGGLLCGIVALLMDAFAKDERA